MPILQRAEQAVQNDQRRTLPITSKMKSHDGK
jgi:hypothetical protein